MSLLLFYLLNSNIQLRENNSGSFTETLVKIGVKNAKIDDQNIAIYPEVFYGDPCKNRGEKLKNR